MPREFLCRIFKRGFDAFAQFLARTFERRLGSFVEHLLSDSNARDYCRRVRVFLSPSCMYMVLYFPACPLAEFQERLHQKTGVLIGIATVDRMIRLKLKLTVKKSLYPTKKGTDAVQLARFEYWQLLKGIPPEDLVFWMSQGLICLLSDDVHDHFRGRELTGNVPIAEEKTSLSLGQSA